MKTMRSHIAILKVMLALLSLTVAEGASSLEIIVHPGVATAELSRAQARLVFAGKITRWQDGSLIRVFILPEEAPLHQELCKGVLDLYPYQLRSAWDRIIYTGIGQAPIQVTTETEMRKRVASVPGAIGYIGKVYSHDKVRALSVR